MLSKSQVKIIKSLHLKKYRQKSSRFIAEGKKIVEELLVSPHIRVEELYLTAENDALFTMPALDPVKKIEVSDQELKSISNQTNPSGILAVCRIPEPPAEIKMKGKVSLLLDAVRDPGNLGTLLRIADWFGIENVICSTDSVEAYNSKVVQASMGSIARVAVHYFDPEQFLSRTDLPPVYAATLDGESIVSYGKISEGILLIGSESHGIHLRLLELADKKITIPRLGKAESLNAAVAAGIICGRLLV